MAVTFPNYGGVTATMSTRPMPGDSFSLPGAFAGGGIGGILGNFFNNPAEKFAEGMQPAMNEIRGATNRATDYLSPWRSAGQSGLTNYMDILTRYKNPEERYNQIMSGWKMSPGARFQMEGAMDAIKNSMATRGLMGSGQELKDLGQTYEGFASKDMRDYLNDILGIERTGLQGYGNLGQWGQEAATNTGKFEMQGASDIASMMNAIAQAEAAQAKNENSFFGDIGAGLGGLLWL